MSDTMNYNQKIQELIGSKGFIVLRKAIAGIPNLDIAKTDEYLQDMQIVSRGLCHWFQKSLTNIEKNTNSFCEFKIPTTEFSILVKKNINNEFSGNFLSKNNDKIEFINASLPHVIALFLTISDNFDVEKEEKQDLFKSLQNLINYFVDQNLFNVKNIEIQLNKNENSAICPDCKESIKLDEQNKKLCFCYKFLGKNSLHIYRDAQDNLKVSFDSKWEKENIALLAKVLKKRIEVPHE